MKKLSNRGFSPIVVVILIAIVGLVAGAAYYALSRKDSDNPNNNQPKNYDTYMDMDHDHAGHSTADWAAFSSEAGKFSLKHPKSWVRASNLDQCAGGSLLIGANESSVGNCASENGGQMAVYSNEGDVRARYELDSAENINSYPDVETKMVTVKGVTGKKQVGTYKRPANAEGMGLEDGTKLVFYTFFTNNRTYHASYTVNPDYPDALDDFNMMILRTLAFED